MSRLKSTGVAAMTMSAVLFSIVAANAAICAASYPMAGSTLPICGYARYTAAITGVADSRGSTTAPTPRLTGDITRAVGHPPVRYRGSVFHDHDALPANRRGVVQCYRRVGANDRRPGIDPPQAVDRDLNRSWRRGIHLVDNQDIRHPGDGFA